MGESFYNPFIPATIKRLQDVSTPPQHARTLHVLCSTLTRTYTALYIDTLNDEFHTILCAIFLQPSTLMLHPINSKVASSSLILFYSSLTLFLLLLHWQSGLVEVEEGMLIIKLPHFVIPLIVRKSDGTYTKTLWSQTDIPSFHRDSPFYRYPSASSLSCTYTIHAHTQTHPLLHTYAYALSNKHIHTYTHTQHILYSTNTADTHDITLILPHTHIDSPLNISRVDGSDDILSWFLLILRERPFMHHNPSHWCHLILSFRILSSLKPNISPLTFYFLS